MVVSHEKKGGNVPLAVGATAVAGVGTAAAMTHVLQPKDIQLGLEGIGKNVPAASIKNVQNVAEKATEAVEQAGVSIPGLADQLKENAPALGEKVGKTVENAKDSIGNVAKNGSGFLKENWSKFDGLKGGQKAKVLAATVAAATVAGLIVHHITKKPSTTLDHHPEAMLAGRVQQQSQAQGHQI
jgi:hypothetical protein